MSCSAEIDESGDLGGGYRFKADGGMMWIRGANVYEEGIPGNVTDYTSDSNFIIAKQEPSKEYYHYFFSSDIVSRYFYLFYNNEVIENPNELQRRFMNSKWWLDPELKRKMSGFISSDNYNNDEEIYRIVDSVVTHDPEYKKIFASKVNYWILVKRGNLVYGPLTKKQYLEKSMDFAIPIDLLLED